MAHADYNCCAICDCKMEYVTFTEATTKEKICGGCLKRLRDLNINVITIGEFLDYINSLTEKKLIELLRELRFRFCFYVSNKVDEFIKNKITSKKAQKEFER